jgi:hypothetical protein
MKTLTALTLAILMALSTTAASEEQASCEQIAGIAKSIMTAHQSGVSIVDMMAITKGNKLLQTITIEAYEGARYSTSTFKESEIAKFRDRWYMWCYKLQANKTES